MDKQNSYTVIVVAPDGSKTEASGGSMVCVIQERAGRDSTMQMNLHSVVSGKEQDLLDMILHLIESIELKGCDNFGATVQRKLKDQAHYTGYIRA
jgi:hypothetical protein